METGWTNYFGLSFQGVRIVPDYLNPPAVQYDITSGGAYADPIPSDFTEYFQNVTAPSLRTVDYYFAKATDPTNLSVSTVGPAPGDSEFIFHVTNTTPLILVPVGQESSIYGWAKQQILNGDSAKFGYLGQYFDKAYKTDTNGTATTNETGILSEYGDFLPTEPGRIVLKTKPDAGQTNIQGQCTVYAVSLNVDANHDSTMDLTYGGPDTTSHATPFEFWVNHDSDNAVRPYLDPGSDAVIPDVEFYWDSQYHQIHTIRDLEDFARLWICGIPALTNGSWQVQIGWTNIIKGDPAINILEAVETNGGMQYLTDTNILSPDGVPWKQLGYGGGTFNQKYAITSTNALILPTSWFTNGQNKYLLFEGASVGSGELRLTISQGTKVLAQTSAWLDLHNVKDFYERAVITNNVTGAMSNWTSGIKQINRASSPALAQDSQVVVFVHGINVDDDDWNIESDTVFKRLYWAGYSGKFATVKWPCNKLTPIPKPLTTAVFNQSDLKAYKASTAFATYLSQLHGRLPDDRIHLLVHSQGNSVVSEALAHSSVTVDTYILSQGAVSDSAYDTNATADLDLIDAEQSEHTPDWQPWGYRGSYTNIPERMVNFFNPADGVVAMWVENQDLLKPSVFLDGAQYLFDGTNSYYYPLIGSRYTVTDPQESRAMVARSRTLAVGQSGPAGPSGIIQRTVDLNAQYGFFDSIAEHSAQWTRPIQSSLLYYRQVLIRIQPTP